MIKTFRGLCTAMVAGALTLAAAGTAALAKDKFVFAWPSAINSGVAPLTFAAQLGYFDKEDMAVQVQVLTGSGVIIPQLMAGNIQGAYSSLEPLIIARQPGKPNYPIMFAYNYLRRSVWEFAVLDDSPVKSFADLKGSTIGVLALSSGNIFMLRAILESQGVPWSSIKLQAVGTGAAAFDALRTRQIQMLNLFDTAHVRLEQSGTKIRRLQVPAEFDGLSSHGISVTQALFKDNPGLIERFGRALTKGTLACQANLDACIRSYWAAYPALKPAPAAEAETLRKEREVLTVRMGNLTYMRPGVTAQMGAFSTDDWTKLIAALKAGGEISDTEIPLSSLYSNALVPGFNRFDQAEVIAQAKAAK